ncbi:MAG: hypothetical protein E7325_11155 [Clostridiales bacterium]|nr:hypothetical protein [Clostridiales bacterium]
MAQQIALLMIWTSLTAQQNCYQKHIMLSVTEFVTSSQIRNRLSRPKASVARLLSKMCDEGLLQAVGAGRETKYQKSAHFS